MRDEKRWTLGVVQFQALRAAIPTLIPEKLVQEYHAILELLAAASEEDFTAFRIPQEEIRPRVTGGQMGSYRQPGRTFYSKDNFCDRNLFKRKIEALSRYLPSIEQSFRIPANPPSGSDYYEMSDEALEQLAIKYKMEEYGQSSGKAVNRNAIIKQLQARDRAIREANPVPNQTITVGTMVHSAIQQGSPGATAKITVNSADLKAILDKLKDVIAQLGLDGADEKEVRSDIAIVELQLASDRPKGVVITECLRSIRTVLEGAVGSVIAGGLVFEIDKVMKVLGH